MDNNIENHKLYIPTNVKTKTEIYDGFGTKELLSSLSVSVPIAAILFIIKTVMHKSTAFFVLGIMITLAAAALIFVRDNTNQNVVDYVKNIIIFNGRQKQYIYSKNIDGEEQEQIEIANEREKRYSR